MWEFLTVTLGLKLNTPLEIAGQCVGLIALIFAISSFQMKTQKKINALQCCASVFWTFSYFFIGSIVGALSNIVAIFRGFVYSKTYTKKWAEPSYWSYIFSFGFVIVYILNFTVFKSEVSFINLFKESLPIIGSIILCFSLRMKKAKTVRILFFCSSPMWLVYNYWVGNIFATIAEISCEVSSIVGILRLDLKKKNSIEEGE
ncbi:MAG: YgjV family protein [Clostridia bacterium]|nr:YgjV family protein [Clostridia bacterium]